MRAPPTVCRPGTGTSFEPLPPGMEPRICTAKRPWTCLMRTRRTTRRRPSCASRTAGREAMGSITAGLVFELGSQFAQGRVAGEPTRRPVLEGSTIASATSSAGVR